MESETKRCPYCGEEILAVAIRCKHCQMMLGETPLPPPGALDGVGTHLPGMEPPVSEPPLSPTNLDDVETIPPGEIKRILGGRYELHEELGRGGMGIVYKARDTQLGTDVAIKTLPTYLARDSRGTKLLKNEAVASMKLAHPNIVKFHNFEDHPDGKFLIMEFIDGKTLDQLLDQSPDHKLSEKDVIKYAIETCKGLGFAHSEGVIHRDIKPSNIMVDSKGRVKIADFGIARVLKDSHTKHTGMVTSGTLLYMSPEQCTGKSSNALSDIYSLGISVYELLAGKTPFESAVDVTYCHKYEPVKPIEGISDRLNQILQKCCAKQPEDRYHTARQLRMALLGRGQTEMPSVLISHKTEESRNGRNPFAVIATALLALLVVTGAISGIAAYRKAQVEARQEEEVKARASSEMEKRAGAKRKTESETKQKERQEAELRRKEEEREREEQAEATRKAKEEEEQRRRKKAQAQRSREELKRKQLEAEETTKKLAEERKQRESIDRELDYLEQSFVKEMARFEEMRQALKRRSDAKIEDIQRVEVWTYAASDAQDREYEYYNRELDKIERMEDESEKRYDRKRDALYGR